MNFFYESLAKSMRMGTYTDASPFEGIYAITPNEISFTGGYVEVTAVSAGVNAGNPATISFEYSMDGGLKWRAVTGITVEPITGVGQFIGEAGGSVFVGPLLKIVITPPAGESVTLADVGIRRIRPGQVATLLAYGSGGGGLGDVGLLYLRGPGGGFANTKPTFDTTTPANNRPLPVTLTGDGEAEVTGTQFDKVAPNDSRGLDILSYAVNTTLGAWVTPQVDTLPVATAWSQGLDVVAAPVGVTALGLWNGVTRDEVVSEAVAVAAKKALALATTQTLPVTAVLVAWEAAATAHRELEVVTLAAAQYAAATPQVLATSPLMGWDATNLTHKEALVDGLGNLQARSVWIRDGVEAVVVEDTANPAVNMPLPVQPMAMNNVAGGFKSLQETEQGFLQVQEAVSVAGTFYNDYVGTPVTTGAWVELSAGIGNDMKFLEIFDSSGSLLELGIGALGVEARKILIFPGGNGKIPIDIPTGTRLTLRAVDADATVGFFAANWYRG